MMNILLATDGSSHAHAAITLVQRLPLPQTIDLTLLTVIEPGKRLDVDEAGGSDASPDVSGAGQGAQQREGERLLEREAARFKDSRWTIRTLLREGHVAHQILETASELGMALIVVGARGLSSMQRFLLGSVSHKVMKHAPCNVLIVRMPDQDAPAATSRCRMLLAYDGSPPAHAAVDLLASWPLGDRTEIVITTVLTLMTYYRMDIMQQLSAQWQQEKQAALAELETTAATLRRATPNVTTQLREGPDPSQEILNTAAEQNASLIVVGHKGHSRIERFLLGSVANRMVHYADCSVLVVRE